MHLLRSLLLWSACATVVPAGAAGPAVASEAVIVNAQPLSSEEVRALEQRFAIQTRPGRYWYDAVSGAWGFERGPTAGFLPPGLKLGGALRADASGGGTGVFINGREIHPLDVAALSRIGPVWRGRWWVNAQGYFGPEGGPVWGNLWAAAQQRGGVAGGSSSNGRQFLGRDSDGCFNFQGSNLVGGPTTGYSPGC
jgi:hypothetical protein